MIPENQFTIAVYKPLEDGIAQNISQFLETRMEPDEPLPSKDASVLFLKIDGKTWLDESVNFGSLPLVIQQLGPLRQRLDEGLPGLLRSGVRDAIGVQWYLFEPEQDCGGSVQISEFLMSHPDMKYWFPIEDWLDSEPEELYTWVLEHRDELLAAEGPFRLNEDRMLGIEVPKEWLLETLEVQENLGRAMLELLGNPTF